MFVEVALALYPSITACTYIWYLFGLPVFWACSIDDWHAGMAALVFAFHMLGLSAAAIGRLSMEICYSSLYLLVLEGFKCLCHSLFVYYGKTLYKADNMIKH